jgi:hypothetical protein
VPEPPDGAGAGVASLADRRTAREQADAAAVGAPPDLVADVGELGELTALALALAAETEADDHTDMDRVAARHRESAELNARIDALMGRNAAGLGLDPIRPPDVDA